MTGPGGRPIFVVGFQRSGTTLLQSLLGSHPRIASPPETYFLFRIARLADHYGDLHVDANLRHAVHDTLNPPTSLFAECGFDEDVLFERIKDGPRTMRSILDVMMSDFATRQGKARWSEKTPGQTAGEVFATFPDAQVIHIVRDPRDVIASSLRTPWTTAEPFQLAQAWKRGLATTTRAGLKAGPASFIQVRYEDLTRDPVTVLGGIFTFLGEPFDPELHADPERRKPTIAAVAAPWQRRALEEITPAKEGGWRTALSTTERSIVAAVLHGEIATLGYEAAGTRDRARGMVLALPKVVAAKINARRLKGTMRDPQHRSEATQQFLIQQARALMQPGCDTPTRPR